MRKPRPFLVFLALLVTVVFQFQAHAAPAGPIIKHLSSLLKWSRSSSKSSQPDVNFLQFEDGYLVETVVEGNVLGVVPYSMQISQDGELFAVDALSSNIVRITPPLSQYSRARLVAGSFQGYTGHVDGKPSDARFNHPKSVTMDDKGNVYVADPSNFAIRKIGEGGVTTIAGGKSNVAGYRDGPSEHAMFSNDFEVVYVKPTCSLLVVDRGNAALRQISLNEEDCNHHYSSISGTDVIMVIGAVLVGYIFSSLQQGYGPTVFSRVRPLKGDSSEQLCKEKPAPIVESVREEPEAAWPSFGCLIIDLSKFALEALASAVLCFIPFRIKPRSVLPKGLTPLKDTLKMPDDMATPPLPELKQQQHHQAPPMQLFKAPMAMPERFSETGPPKMKPSGSQDPALAGKHSRPSKQQEFAEFYGRVDVSPPPPYGSSQPLPEPKQQQHHQAPPMQLFKAPMAMPERFSETGPPKMKPSGSQDPALAGKQHRPSKQQEFSEFHGRVDVSPPPPYGSSQPRSRSQKERPRHRQRERGGEPVRPEPKPAELKPVDYDDPRLGHSSTRHRYRSYDSFRL